MTLHTSIHHFLSASGSADVSPARLARPLVILSLQMLLAACSGNREINALLDAADSLTATRPDSALTLLTTAGRESGLPHSVPDTSHWSNSQLMRRELLRARAMNKAYVTFTTDSTLIAVARYYDRHGTPNEQMEAHYLLGCAYRDMGEAPRAVDCYLDAVAKADTTAHDCNYLMMGNIYAQMAWLYQQQLLWSYEKEAHRKATYCNLMAGDTLCALYEQKAVASVYILEDKKDSAEMLLNDVIRLYREKEYEQEAIQTSTMLMRLYIEQPQRQRDLKRLIDAYESRSKSFDSRHELPPSKRKYYYYKGKYFEGENSLDSAEYYYRKMYRPNMSFVSLDPMYKGLLSVYRKRHLSDSIAKYSQLYCEVNDSSVAHKDQNLTAQMAASYNYNSYHKLALENAEDANRFMTYAVLFLTVAVFGVAATFFFRNKYLISKQERQLELQRLKSEHENAINHYVEKLKQLQGLESSHKKVIQSIRQEIAESQNVIEKLNLQFQIEREGLMRDITASNEKVGMLERQLNITGYKQNSMPFLSLGIVKRVRIYAKRAQLLLEEDKQILEDAAKEQFPELFHDLDCAIGISKLGRQVCLLVLLNLQPNEITKLLGISSSQVGNLKKDINKALFGDSTAKTLYKNLSSRYKILAP